MQSTLIVVSAEDGKRYKLVMKGDLGRLRIRKLKRYLESTTGTAVPDQVLCHGDDVLQDDYTGDEVGLYDGMVLMLTRKPPLRDIGTGFLGDVGWTGGDIDGLEAKKKQILMDRQRRNEDFERQKERVARTVFSTEHQRRRLELELMEREAKLRKLSEEEERVLCDRERLEQLRTAEHKREKLRIYGLEERQRQLEAEQERIRAIELKRLDVERKHKLVESSRRDYFLERERMDQEKFNFEDRLRQQELDIRQKELLLDRERIETERLQRQLDREKAVLLRQKRIEEGMSQKERCLEDRMLHDLACDAPPPLDAQYGTDLGPASASVGPFPPTHTMSRETELYSPAPTVSANASHSLLQTLLQPSSHRTGYRTGLVSSAPRVSISNSGMVPTVPVPHSSSLTTTDSYLLAEENLRLFAQDLGIHSLRFDENYTCVVSVEDKYTLLLTYDPATERLYLYSTLLTRLPKNTTSRLQLYEFLLEGALLGRDMSGGGVGVSIKNDFVLMATSILLPKSQPDTLRSIVPSFVENITRWRTRLREVLGVEASAVTDYDHPATISLHGTTNTHRGAYPMIGLEVTEGVVRNGVFTRYTDGVAVLSAHGPALAAGIYEGDVITSLNSVRVTSLRDLTFAVNSLLPGSTAAVGIQRRDRAMTLEVNVAASVYRPGMKQRNVVPVDRSPHVSPQRRL